MTLNKPDWWDEWTCFDREAREIKLKENVPAKVRREWKHFQSFIRNEPKIIHQIEE